MFLSFDLFFIMFLCIFATSNSGFQAMMIRDVFGNPWFVRCILVLWLVSSVFVLFLLGMIDSIVHGDLYDFGLQFSYVWASPYWAFLRLIYVCFLLPLAFSVVVLGLDLWRLFKGDRQGRVPEPRRKVGEAEQSSMLIACSGCGKVFSKPICVLDFTGKKPRLVNVCPYCNAKLGEANTNQKESSVSTGILGPKEQEITE